MNKGSGQLKPPDVVRAFIDRINTHDNDGLVSLMAPQYTFVDSLGNKFPYATARNGWKQYFTMVPDYWIQVEDMVGQDEVVIAFGKAGGTFVPQGGEIRPQNRWQTPAVWRAVVSDGKIAEWRVYCDNEPIREKMRAAAAPQ